MARVQQVGRVLVPVADQDAAIAWYTDKLGFTVAADVSFGEGERWVEVAPPSGGANLALVPERGDYRTGRMTGVALTSGDVAGDHAELRSNGVDADDLLGGDGTVPPMFFFRDGDGNTLLLVAETSR
ncbi:MAG TPA: VOC family protein [Gaiellaceae bacterium]|nr:VOC family protein [Gaiellaceae bacterium]